MSNLGEAANYSIRSIFVAASLSLLLSACGGGGGRWKQ